MKLFSDTTAWHKANLHTHTTVSDGKKTPEETEKIYRDAGYDILAISDHWRSGASLETPEFIRLGAMELNTQPYMSTGDEETYHFVALGIPDGLVQMSDKHSDPQCLIDEIHSYGGFAVLAHPAWSLNTSEDIEKLNGVDAIEIYNTMSDEPINPGKGYSGPVLDPVFNRGKLYPLLASDDTHRYTADVCVSSTMVQTDDFTIKGVLSAIKEGKSYATTGPRIKQVELTEGHAVITCSPCLYGMAVTNHPWMRNACVTADGDGTRFEFDIAPNTRFVRFTVKDSAGRCAWTNPVKWVF